MTRARLARSLAVVDIVAFFVSATLDPTPDYGAGLMYFLGIGAFVSIGALLVSLQTVLTPITGGQTIAVAASTLAVFALFQPVRRRVQTAVDRRFDRSRYDGQRMADAFVGRLRDVIDIGTVTTDLDATVRAAVRPTTLRLWLRRGPTR